MPSVPRHTPAFAPSAYGHADERAASRPGYGCADPRRLRKVQWLGITCPPVLQAGQATVVNEQKQTALVTVRVDHRRLDRYARYDDRPWGGGIDYQVDDQTMAAGSRRLGLLSKFLDTREAAGQQNTKRGRFARREGPGHGLIIPQKCTVMPAYARRVRSCRGFQGLVMVTSVVPAHGPPYQ